MNEILFTHQPEAIFKAHYGTITSLTGDVRSVLALRGRGLRLTVRMLPNTALPAECHSSVHRYNSTNHQTVSPLLATTFYYLSFPDDVIKGKGGGIPRHTKKRNVFSM